VSILPVLVILYGAATLLSLYRPAKWPAELLTHFRPQWIAAGLLGAALCSAAADWGWAAIALGLALTHYAAMPAQLWFKPETRLAATPGLTIVWANVWKKRKALERTLVWAQAMNADVVVIAEFPTLDAAGVATGAYLHRVDTGQHPRKPYSVQMVAFSRLPVVDSAVHDGPGPMQRPFLSFSIMIGDWPVRVVAAHPVPPYTPAMQEERDAHIALLGPITQAPFVLAGDFNCTPWSPGYGKIPGTHIGAYMFAPTWLTRLPLIGLPIDHIMVSVGLRASAFRIGPATGSDHRPIMARVHPERR
jgi:endonuclease/exonuclease/phosphatase (EEP) superfamily protein YafD